MRNYKYFNKKPEESKAAKILAVIMVVMVAALIAVSIWEMLSETTQPDITYPMTNQHIEWTGAGYGG